jgi:hypothetical protein
VFPGSLSKILELQPPEQPKQFSPKRPIIGGTRKKKAILPDFNTLRIKNIVVPTVAIQASTSRARSSTPTPRSYTLRVRPLHALDLYDPCSINKCTHDFLPRVKIQTNGQEHIQSAAHHARNHSVWVHSDMIFPIEKRNENLSINVTVWNFCQDTNTQFLIGEAGVSLSEIYEIKELSQFFPICRVHHDTQGIITRYITGKIKLRISIETEKELQESTDTSSHVKTETVEIKESPAILAAILAKDPPLETSAGNTEMDENKVPVVEEKAPTTPPSTHFRPQLPFSPIKFSGEDFSLNRRNLKAVAPLKTTSEVPVVDSCIRRSEWDPQVIAGLFAEIQEETKAYQIPQSRLKIYESIGEGVHASVKYAKLQLPVTTDSQEQQEVDVAVKEFRYSIHPPPPKVLECFRHEYRTLSALSHRNIVKYIGVSLDQPLAILTEFLQNGSLHKCINDPAQWNHVSIQKVSHDCYTFT